MILRASDRAMSDLLARNNLRAKQLWAELDSVQAQIASLPYLYRNPDYNRLATRERDLFAQLDRLDD